jgi:hypothetical protein
MKEIVKWEIQKLFSSGLAQDSFFLDLTEFGGILQSEGRWMLGESLSRTSRFNGIFEIFEFVWFERTEELEKF